MSLSAMVQEYKGKKEVYAVRLHLGYQLCIIGKQWQSYPENKPIYECSNVGKRIIADWCSKDNLCDKELPRERDRN
jgi:hypothetical protein